MGNGDVLARLHGVARIDVAGVVSRPAVEDVAACAICGGELSWRLKTLIE
jgi:hypothetical protein